MTCVIGVAAAQSLNTHWSMSAEPFLSCSLAANFDTLHAARDTCRGDLQNNPNPTVIKEALMVLSRCEDRVEIGCTVSEK